MNKPNGVWDDLVDPAEAPAMRLRSLMLMRISEQVKGWGQNPEVICQKLFISNGRLHDLLAGHIDLFSYDELVELLPRADLNLEAILKEGLRRAETR
uniref:HigA2-like helix-turn-helix domain-containing protein n=1 Tax=Pseudomonas phage HRDY3 TaxID=3236930 RepID=A0AB39CE90_9VIRU